MTTIFHQYLIPIIYACGSEAKIYPPLEDPAIGAP